MEEKQAKRRQKKQHIIAKDGVLFHPGRITEMYTRADWQINVPNKLETDMFSESLKL